MCFSATASFAAGGALSAAGVLTIKKAKKRSELPLASVSLLAGIQQIIEGIVWISFNRPLLNTIATYAYVAFSHVLWPVFIPLSILLVEHNPIRKKVLAGILTIGLFVGLRLAFFVEGNPITACIVNQSIDYSSPAAYPPFMMALYVIAICGSAFASSHKMINLFGVALLVSFAISIWLYLSTFFSVWCFFAAVLSLLIYAHFKLGVKGSTHSPA